MQPDNLKYLFFLIYLLLVLLWNGYLKPCIVAEKTPEIVTWPAHLYLGGWPAVQHPQQPAEEQPGCGGGQQQQRSPTKTGYFSSNGAEVV